MYDLSSVVNNTPKKILQGQNNRAEIDIGNTIEYDVYRIRQGQGPAQLRGAMARRKCGRTCGYISGIGTSRISW